MNQMYLQDYQEQRITEVNLLSRNITDQTDQMPRLSGEKMLCLWEQGQTSRYMGRWQAYGEQTYL